MNIRFNTAVFRTSWVLFLFGFSYQLVAQSDVDSMMRELRTETEDTTRVKLMYNIAVNIKKADLDKAMQYAEEGMALSKKIDYKRGIASMLRLKANILADRGDSEKALPLLKQAYDIIKKTPYKAETILVLNDIGSIYTDQSNYPEGLKYFEQALRMGQELKDDYIIGLAYGNFSTVFSHQEDLEKSLLYAKKSLHHYRKHGIKKFIADALAKIGTAYYKMDSMQQASGYYNEALRLYRKSNHMQGEAIVLQDMALLSPSIPTRLKYQLEAQEIWDRFNPKHYNSIINLGNIGGNYILLFREDSIPGTVKQKKEYLAKAEYYLNRALEFSRFSKNQGNEADMLYYLSELKKSQEDYKTALEYITRSFELSDSIYSQENKNKLAAIESKREIEMRDNQIEINRLALENERHTRWALTGGSFLLLIIGGMLVYQNRQGKRHNDQLRAVNAELDEANRIKTRFFSILNHDLRSPVSNVLSYVRLQQNSGIALDDETKQRLQAQTISSAENLLSSMEDLLLWSKGQMEQFKPVYKEVAVAQLFEDTQKHFHGVEQVSFLFEDPEGLLLHTDTDYLKTIMRNLTSNAVKALNQREDRRISWRAWSGEEGKYLAITDNGPGGTQEQFRALYDDTATVGIKTGLGLHLIRDLAKAINCNVTVHSNPGEGTEIVLHLG